MRPDEKQNIYNLLIEKGYHNLHRLVSNTVNDFSLPYLVIFCDSNCFVFSGFRTAKMISNGKLSFELALCYSLSFSNIFDK